MGKPKTDTSTSFTQATRIERERLDRKRRGLIETQRKLKARVARVEGELAAVSEHLQSLERLAEGGGSIAEHGNASSSHGPVVLRGASIREVAIPLLLHEEGSGPIHYRRWYELLRERGYAVAGQRPEAVFLGQISRSPMVASAQSGFYSVDLDAPKRLRQTLRDRQLKFSRLGSDVPSGARERAQWQERYRELNAEVARTRRELDEALRAAEAQPGGRASEPKEA